MTNLPPHIGRLTDDETGYALTCTLEQNGPLCGAPARWHVMWTDDGENSHACDAHKRVAYSFDPVEIHPNKDGACGMPGSVWLKDEHRCVMEALEGEPARAVREQVPA